MTNFLPIHKISPFGRCLTQIDQTAKTISSSIAGFKTSAGFLVMDPTSGIRSFVILHVVMDPAAGGGKVDNNTADK